MAADEEGAFPQKLKKSRAHSRFMGHHTGGSVLITKKLPFKWNSDDFTAGVVMPPTSI